MKHGAILPPLEERVVNQEFLLDRIKNRISAWRNFILIVLVPTMVVSGYEYLIAADQYQTTSEFIVKSGDSSRVVPSGLGQFLGISGGASQSESEVMSVPDYLRSFEVINELSRSIDLVSIFRRPESDFISRIWDEHPKPESLQKYYLGKVNVRYDRETGLIYLSVRTFRPRDSYRIASELLVLGERKVNEMNRRRYEDAVRSARQQLEIAQKGVSDIQRKMTGFRQFGRDIDPQTSGEAQIKLVSGLNSDLAAARAQLGSMNGLIRPDSPQYVALQHRIASMERVVASQTDRLTGDKSAIAEALGTYEDLRIRQDFAAKSYEAAATNLQRANEEARKQQLYFVRVVDPNMPVKPLFPERGKIVLTLLCGLMLFYSIGWLIVAGVREHEA